MISEAAMSEAVISEAVISEAAIGVQLVRHGLDEAASR